jgi:prepilin-type N-terminal cleavage/methylation domain-containing protein/prepilin-type processing-associated H-X9-DG protein
MKKAFTLIELLVVIAIIAILAAILFPVFAQAKAAAKKVSDLSNVKQISLGLFLYINDYDDAFPQTSWEQDTLAAQSTPGFAGTYNPQNPAGTYQIHWTFNIQPYIKNWNIFVSPLDSTPIKTDNPCPNGLSDVGKLNGSGQMYCDWSAQQQSYIPFYNVVPAHDWTVVNSTEFSSPANQAMVGGHRFDGLPADDHKGVSGFYPSQPCGGLNGGSLTALPAVGAPVATTPHASVGYVKFTGTFLSQEYAYMQANGASASTLWKNTFKDYDAVRVSWDLFGAFAGGNYGFADGHAKYQTLGQLTDPNSYEFGDKWYPGPQPWNSNPSCS